MNKAVTGLMIGVLIAVVVGIGASAALAHGGGRGGTSSYGMGHMGMMGESGSDYHMGGGMGHMDMMRGRDMAGHMHGMGHMGMSEYGMGGHHMGGMGRVEMLDLTKEQRTSIHRLQDQLRKANWDAMGKMMDESSKLRELFAVDKPDAKKIGAVYGNIFDLRRQMIENKIDTQNRVDAVLTAEQREQLKQRGHGHGHGAGRGGHGMMYPRTGQGG